MGFQIAGLPLHPLLVHAAVVLTPLTVLAVLLSTFWPAARRRLGIVTPLAALIVLILVPITVLAGQALAETIGSSPAVAIHQSWGELLLPWVIGLFLVALGQWIWFRLAADQVRQSNPTLALAAQIVLAVLAVGVSAGVMILLVLIGDSGSRAVWGGILG